jgi:hypothetical protein
VQARIQNQEVNCLGDTGAWNFVDYRFCQKNKIKLEKLINGFTVALADGTLGKNIDFAAKLTLTFPNKLTTTDWFLVTQLGNQPITLGIPWFKRHIPEVTQAFERITLAANFAAEVKAGGGVIPEEFSDYSDVFNLNYDEAPPRPTHGHVFKVQTIDNKLPTPATQYPVAPKDKRQDEEDDKELLKLGRIEPGEPGTAAASFYVNKACRKCHQLRCTCGSYDHPRRRVIDYRPLNELTNQDAYPLPHIRNLLMEAPGHQWYIKFDIDSAFHLVPVAPEDRHKTAFVTSTGLYQWTVMPFGAKNAPATFQRMIDAVLAPARPHCRAYMDDGIVWANTKEELTARFRAILELLRQAGLRLKLTKCEFFQQSVTYLGNIISSEGLSPDPEKSKAILDWPQPRTKTDIRGFLGLCNYYGTFMPRYAEIAGPLTEATTNKFPDSFEELSPPAMTAFMKICEYWSNPLNLGAFDENAPTKMFTDCSGEAWFGVIEQKGRPIAFGSGRLTATERRWSATDRELYACLMMHRKFGYMLLGHVTWYTDHNALKALKTTLANTPRRTHWSDELNMYPFVVRWMAGKDMHVDGLTRHSTFEKDNGYGNVEPLLDETKFDLDNWKNAGLGDKFTMDTTVMPDSGQTIKTSLAPLGLWTLHPSSQA